jgi:MbtH protein
MNNDDIDDTIFKVVVNHEEQFSIWPAHRSNPQGWRDAGRSGSKTECLAYVREVWIDMRPLSLRNLMNKSDRTTNTSNINLNGKPSKAIDINRITETK